jgi:hypothetical protein
VIVAGAGRNGNVLGLNSSGVRLASAEWQRTPL